ncbi:MAG: PilZ domain-containing protein [Isosphaeraceae bacterium]
MKTILIDEARDQRRSCRYEPVQSAIHLGWWDEPEFRSVPGGLRNLSTGGALLDAPVRPPQDESLWICMSGLPAGDWAEVRVVSVTPQPRSDAPYQIRVAFREGCPYELFSQAVHGISAGH